MYDDHYGFDGRPFQLTPDPRFWFETATHRKAMAYLGYGLSQGEGFIVITGDVGAGKTTLVGHLMATVDRDRLHVIKIVSTQIEADDLLRLVAGGLSVETGGLNKSQLLTAIERGLHATARGGKRTLLIVDEAQALPVSSLEELRMLSNFQAGGHALLQIFLLGQPEFRERLHGSERLEQLRQRVIAMHHLDPMGPEEVEPYMVHRLSLVGWRGNPSFTPGAYRALYDGSNGVPRRLNQLAGRVLLFGAIEQCATIDQDVVEAVLADIAGDAPESVRPITAVRAVETPTPTPTPAPTPMPRAVAEVPPPPSAPLPLRATREPELQSVASEPRPNAEPASSAAAETDPALLERIALLESRVEEQDVALRRVLTLLVDWVEIDARPDGASVRAATGR
jgi:general secretion pathway protein A